VNSIKLPTKSADGEGGRGTARRAGHDSAAPPPWVPVAADGRGRNEYNRGRWNTGPEEEASRGGGEGRERARARLLCGARSQLVTSLSAVSSTGY